MIVPRVRLARISRWTVGAASRGKSSRCEVDYAALESQVDRPLTAPTSFHWDFACSAISPSRASSCAGSWWNRSGCTHPQRCAKASASETLECPHPRQAGYSASCTGSRGSGAMPGGRARAPRSIAGPPFAGLPRGRVRDRAGTTGWSSRRSAGSRAWARGGRRTRLSFRCRRSAIAGVWRPQMSRPRVGRGSRSARAGSRCSGPTAPAVAVTLAGPQTVTSTSGSNSGAKNIRPWL